MLLIRSKDEADGESRMMGSGRRVGFLRFETSAGEEVMAVERIVGGTPGRLRDRPRKVSACLRTCEKSYPKHKRDILRQSMVMIERARFFMTTCINSRLV